jgi:hypothetical protein
MSDPRIEELREKGTLGQPQYTTHRERVIDAEPAEEVEESLVHRIERLERKFASLQQRIFGD